MVTIAARQGTDMAQQKTLLITGCSSGIGLDAARTMTRRGWRVFATCRSEADCARLRDEGLESFVLDYADTSSITDAVSEALSRSGGTLDALFNNGAYGMPVAAEDMPTGALRELFEVNFFGWHELVRQVIPVMRSQGHGRIVQNSSGLGIVAYPWRAAYVASKFALEGYTDVLRLEMAGTGIHVSLIEPGLIETKFRVNSIPHFERWVDWAASPRKTQYETEVIPRLQGKAGGRNHAGPEAVTRKLIHALEAPRPSPRYYVTPLVWIAVFLNRILWTRAQDAIVRRL